MRLSELYGAPVRNQAGEKLGRIREVHCNEGRVTQLGVGSGALLARVTGGDRGRRIAWDKVVELRNDAVIVGD